MNINEKLMDLSIKLHGDVYSPDYNIYTRQYHGVGSYTILGTVFNGVKGREVRYNDSITLDENIERSIADTIDYYDLDKEK